jgi:two-component system, NtrC family, sensor kinase
VSDVVELMQARAKDAGVELTWKPLQEIPLLNFDGDAMHRAILNVVTNAIDACENQPDGHVEIRTRLDSDEGTCQIVVHDSGVGIPPEELRKVFSLFESKKGSRGTGLGLPFPRRSFENMVETLGWKASPRKGVALRSRSLPSHRIITRRA